MSRTISYWRHLFGVMSGMALYHYWYIVSDLTYGVILLILGLISWKRAIWLRRAAVVLAGWWLILRVCEPLLMGLVANSFGSATSSYLVGIMSIMLLGYVFGRIYPGLSPVRLNFALNFSFIFAFSVFSHRFFLEWDHSIRYLFNAIAFIEGALISNSLRPLNLKIKSNRDLAITASATILGLTALYYHGSHSEQRKLSIGLFDGRSKWAETRNEYSLSNITMKGGYSYSIMREFLAYNYHIASISDKHISGADLKDLDALLFITPTKPFTQGEIKCIKEYVEQGGRLIVIADHTDLYGHALVLNNLFEGVGISVESNALYHDTNYHAKLISPHGLKHYIRPMTPCSFSISRPFVVTSIADGWINERADYTKPNFFGDFTFTRDDAIGRWVTGGDIPFGYGVISLFGDSTIFSNFAIFLPNNIEQLISLIEGDSITPAVTYIQLLLLVLLLLVLSCASTPIVSITLLSVFTALSAISLQPINRQIEKYFPKEKTIYVYSEPHYLLEAPPGAVPENKTVSSLYSHIARFGIWPLYSGATPPGLITHKSLFITNAHGLDRYLSRTGKKVSHCIVVGPIDNDKYSLDIGEYAPDPLSPLYQFFSLTPSTTRSFYMSDSGAITFDQDNTSILCANANYTDADLGSWWINQPLSPFKSSRLNDFYEWIHDRDDIYPYIYPNSNTLTDSAHSLWSIMSEGGADTQVSLRINHDSPEKIYYLGNGVWASLAHSGEHSYILGGPELFDSATSCRPVKWAGTLIK